jgi:hypothetical protein
VAVALLFLGLFWQPASPTNLIHDSVKRDKALIKSMSPGFIPDPIQDQSAQVIFAGSVSQGHQKIDFLFPEQAKAQNAIGRETDASTGRAKRRSD